MSAYDSAAAKVIDLGMTHFGRINRVLSRPMWTLMGDQLIEAVRNAQGFELAKLKQIAAKGMEIFEDNHYHDSLLTLEDKGVLKIMYYPPFSKPNCVKVKVTKELIQCVRSIHGVEQLDPRRGTNQRHQNPGKDPRDSRQ